LRSRHSPTSSPWTVERADPPAAEPIDLDPDGIHHPADDVEDALVDGDGEVDAAPVLARMRTSLGTTIRSSSRIPARSWSSWRGCGIRSVRTWYSFSRP
jgi:hypothetical protein